MFSNLHSSKYVPAYDGCEWGRYKSNCKFLPRWFRCGLSYYLRPNIIPANFSWVFTLTSPGFLETFRLLPQISDDFPKTSKRCRKCPQMFRRRLSTSEVILETTILACFNFVRTQQSTPSKWSFNAFLDWIFTIYHVLKNTLSGFVSQTWEIVLDMWDRCL